MVRAQTHTGGRASLWQGAKTLYALATSKALGLGLSYSGSRSVARWGVLALVASLAEFVIRLTGQCAINHPVFNI